MPYQTDEDRVRHETELRRQEIIWEAFHGQMVHSDRGAIDLGISALKIAILINAGALVALVAFITQIWNSPDHKMLKPVLCASELFTYGLISGGAAFVVAYFYQSAITASFLPALSEIPLSKKPISKWLTIVIWGTRILMVGFGVVALYLFAQGANTILHAFQNT